jgi:hypothetical protein
VVIELGDELADGRSGERACQPPWVKASLGSPHVPQGPHHAVEGQERLNGELHVNADDVGH